MNKKFIIGAAVFAGVSLIFLIYAAVTASGHSQEAGQSQRAWENSLRPLKAYMESREVLDMYGYGQPDDGSDIMTLMNALNNEARISRDRRELSRESGGGLKVVYKPITLPEFGLIMDGIKDSYPHLRVRDVRIAAMRESDIGYEITMSIVPRQ